MERKTSKVPIPAAQSPAADGDPDELNDDLLSDAQTPTEEDFESVTEEEWVRVNDKAPIWMRWVLLRWSCRLMVKRAERGGGRGV